MNVPSETEGPSPAFALEGAGRSFGSFQALSGVTLLVRRGERVAVVGPSGAGKSTLLKLLNGCLLPTAGSVLILGEVASRLSPRRLRSLRSRIGTIYQQLQLVPQASVLENVLMGRLGSRPALAVALSALRPRDREEVRSILERVGIGEKLAERLDRLSGGEQQRVAVARVLYQAPDVIVADEPFASVDPVRSAEVVKLLVEAAQGRTLVLCTHQLEPALPWFPRVVGLRDGRILFDRDRDDLAADHLAELYRPVEASRSPEPRRRISPSEGAAAGSLVVGASTTPGEYLLPRIVPRFAAAHPAVRLRLLVKDTDEVTRDLLDGAVELAFVGSRRAHERLHFEDLAEDEIVLVAAPGFPGLPAGALEPSELRRLPRVDREPGSATRAVVEAHLSRMGIGLDPEAVVFVAGGAEAQKQAVAAGAGVGFASLLAVEADLAAGRLRRIPVDRLKIPRRLFVAWRSGEILGAPARGLLEVVRAAWMERAA